MRSNRAAKQAGHRKLAGDEIAQIGPGLADPLVTHRQEQIDVITLNRPGQANALSTHLVNKLLELVERLRVDPESRALILTGAGRFFCAGADLKERNRPAQWIWSVRHLLATLEAMPQPSIAAINGPCRGGGTELALACDFRIIAQEATIGLPEIKFGALPSAGGTQRLPKLIGASRAKELIFTGDAIDAQRALEIGLVDQVVPAKDLLKASTKLVSRFLKNPTYALTTAKALINAGSEVPLERGLALEAEFIARMGTPEEREQARRLAADSAPEYSRFFSS